MVRRTRQTQYEHIPNATIWENPNPWLPAGKPKRSITIVIPPFTPIPEGGTEWVAYHLMVVLKLLGFHVVVVTTADSQIYNVADVVISPYAEAANRKVLYRDSQGQPVFVNYNSWEYYFQYYSTAKKEILGYATSSQISPWCVMFMYSNTYDRMFLASLDEIGKQLHTRTAAIWNTVFPQDPLQASWWEERLEFFADVLGIQNWLGYSDAMAQLRPSFMTQYWGSFPQPVPDEIFDMPLPPTRTSGVFCPSTITPGKCLDMLIEACGSRQIPLVIAARPPQGALQTDYWNQKCLPLIRKYRNFVQYIGEVPQATAIQMMGEYEVVANPSLYVEPYGLANVQASARGAWVVAFGAGGFLDSVQNGLTGTLVPVPAGVSYHQVQDNKRLHRDLTKALGDSLDWALTPGNILDPQTIQDNTRQQNSYNAVGQQLQRLLTSIPRS
jgi:glycosyltransferase involved in cell wall biosynthesis